MRVAFVVNHFPVASETFVVNLAAGLLDRGHDVTIFAVLGESGTVPAIHPAIASHSLMDRLYLSRMPNGPIARLRDAPPMIARALLGNLPRAALNPIRYGRRAASLRLLYDTQMCNGHGPFDIVHCHFGTLAMPALALRDIGSLSGRIVVHFRGFDISRLVRERGNGLYEAVFRRADFFLANCEYFRGRAISIGCDAARITVLPSGVDCSQFPLAERKGPPDGVVRLATVARLVEKKGIVYAIEALARLSAEGRSFIYTIAGDGPLGPAIRARADALGIGDRVRLTGQCSQSEVLRLLQDTDLFVSPNVTAANGDQDAPTNTIKEAMAVGLPVVSTRHGGIPELVEDGVSGYLVGERDVDALTDCLRDLMDNADRWPELGAAGRRIVETRYNLSQTCDLLVDLYRQALSSG